MRTKKAEIIIHIIASIILCSYIFVRISFNAGLESYFIIALLNTILLLFHIISLWTIKFNIIREISYIIILPELLAIEVLYEKQTFFALIEVVAVLLLIVTNVILLMKNNKNNTLDFEKKAKKIIKLINGRIVICSLLLLPGYIYIMICFFSHAALLSMDKSLTSDQTYTTSKQQWENMTIAEKGNAISQIVAIESEKLNISITPKVDIVYLPSSLYGYYNDKQNIIRLNAAMVNKSELINTVNTLCHELYHCYQYTLIDRYDSDPNKLLNYTQSEITKIELYKYEFDHYENVGFLMLNYKKYENQVCETDARNYANRADDDYITLVD